MNKESVTNRVMTVVSSVSSNWGKSEPGICNRKKRGFKVNFFLIGIILALLPDRYDPDTNVLLMGRYRTHKGSGDHV